MKKVLVDKDNNILFTGNNSKEVLRILTADVYSVTEEDEIIHMDDFKSLLDNKGICKHGELTYEIHFDLQFRGIDDYHRPVFKDVDSKLYFGDVNKLWNYEESGKDYEALKEYYRKNPDALEYFGSSFNCEPHGGSKPFFKFNII